MKVLIKDEKNKYYKNSDISYICCILLYMALSWFNEGVINENGSSRK